MKKSLAELVKIVKCMTWSNYIVLPLAWLVRMGHGANLPALPDIPAPLPVNSVPLGNSRYALEGHLDLPIAPGPFETVWPSRTLNSTSWFFLNQHTI